MKRADVRCRPGDRFLELRIHGRPCVVEGLARNAEPPGGQGDAVELFGVPGDRGIPFGLDAAQDFGDRIDDLGGKPGLRFRISASLPVAVAPASEQRWMSSISRPPC